MGTEICPLGNSIRPSSRREKITIFPKGRGVVQRGLSDGLEHFLSMYVFGPPREDRKYGKMK